MVYLAFIAAMFGLCFLSGYFATLELQWAFTKRVLTAVTSGVVGGVLASFAMHLEEPVKIFMLIQFPCAFFLSITDLASGYIDTVAGHVTVFMAILAGVFIYNTAGIYGLAFMLALTAIWFVVNRVKKQETVSYADFPFFWLVGVNGLGAILVVSLVFVVVSLLYLARRAKTLPMVPYGTLGLIIYYVIVGVTTLPVWLP